MSPLLLPLLALVVRPAPSVWFLESPSDVAPYFSGAWQVQPLAGERRADARKAVDEAASRYPRRMVEEHAGGGVFVAADLAVDGVRVGGMSGGKIGLDRPFLFLSAGGSAEAQGRALREEFHHELAHVALRAHPKAFPQAEWLAVNPKGFAYAAEDGLDVLRGDKADLVSEDEARRAGFARAYGRASFAEDVATVAELLMTGGASLRSALEGHPWLRAKCDSVWRFYRGLYPDLKAPDGWDLKGG